MNGAESLVATARAAGVEICFANPGTTEMPVVNALDTVPGVRGVLGLFEGVCTGAADAYSRLAKMPALTLLHLGPGFANGVANLHNARRAGTGLVNIVGDHASWHRAADAPLNMDVESLVGTVSGWQRTVRDPHHIPGDMADALSAALAGKIATLVVPHDYQLAEVGDPLLPAPVVAPPPVDEDAVAAAADLLRTLPKSALILGGDGLTAAGQMVAARIAAATGASLLASTFAGRADRGTGLPNPARIPYFPEDALAALRDYQGFVLVDSRPPVAFFGYDGMPSYFIRADQSTVAIGRGRNTLTTLEALADALDAPATAPTPTPATPPPMPAGPLTPQAIGAVLTNVQPENAIIVNEGVRTGGPYGAMSAHARPHTAINITGGAIGWGLPAGVGAALACPDRPVIGFQADGSGMYTVQALWSQARTGLNVTTLVASNRRYQILQLELQRAGIQDPGPHAAALTDLSDPAIGWAQLAQGLGVAGKTVATAEELAGALKQALNEPGPHLIEMLVA